MTEAQIAQAVILKNQGFSQYQITEILNVPRSSVKFVLKR